MSTLTEDYIQAYLGEVLTCHDASNAIKLDKETQEGLRTSYIRDKSEESKYTALNFSTGS